ncbi:MAG: hypothetical protein KDA33_17920 [Phycisphaerales bacterium]|nr:hypothetical protein [Phycisphaerales bacterium]
MTRANRSSDDTWRSTLPGTQILTGRIADPLYAEDLRAIRPILVDQERAEGFALPLDDDAESFFSSPPPADQAAIVQHLPNAKAAMWMRFLAPDDVADDLQSIERSPG